MQRAVSLNGQGQRDAARRLLEGCRIAHPAEKRYLVELAGLAFLDRDRPSARSYLRRALALDPRDAYANEFLGTLLFLDRDLPAALFYWNRAGRPRVSMVSGTEQFPFELLSVTPGAVLPAAELRAARDRIEALRLGPLRTQLTPRADGMYDVRLSVPGGGVPQALARSFRGLAYQSLTPGWSNVGGTGVSWSGLFRWDAQKRRMANTLTGPLFGSSKWRFEAGADLRSEIWNTGTLRDFRLESAEGMGAIGAVESARWQWSTGLALSSRALRDAGALAEGAAMESQTRAQVVLLERPQSHLTVTGTGWADVGRFYSGSSGGAYGRWRGDVSTFWQPHGSRDDRLAIRGSAGVIRGAVPFDRQFILGTERDTDLWLRGHFATRDGKKGSGLIGGQYTLLNTQYEVEVYRRPLLTVTAGPFFDTGALAGTAWQYDAGAQLRVTVLGSVSLVLSWGRDLRSGRHSWYLSNGLFGPFGAAR